jgi:hypothetical protein
MLCCVKNAFLQLLLPFRTSFFAIFLRANFAAFCLMIASFKKFRSFSEALLLKYDFVLS